MSDTARDVEVTDESFAEEAREAEARLRRSSRRRRNTVLLLVGTVGLCVALVMRPFAVAITVPVLAAVWIGMRFSSRKTKRLTLALAGLGTGIGLWLGIYLMLGTQIIINVPLVRSEGQSFVDANSVSEANLSGVVPSFAFGLLATLSISAMYYGFSGLQKRRVRRRSRNPHSNTALEPPRRPDVVQR